MSRTTFRSQVFSCVIRFPVSFRAKRRIPVPSLCLLSGRLLEGQRSLSRWLGRDRRLRHVAIGDREAVALADAIENHAHAVVVRIWSVLGAAVEHVDALGEVREALLHEWNEAARGRGFQKQRTPPYTGRVRATRRTNYIFDRCGIVGEARNHRHHQHVASDSHARQLVQRAQSEARSRRTRLEDSLQLAIERYQREVHRQLRASIYFSQQLEVAYDQARLGCDRQVQSLELRENFLHRSRQAVLPLSRL